MNTLPWIRLNFVTLSRLSWHSFQYEELSRVDWIWRWRKWLLGSHFSPVPVALLIIFPNPSGSIVSLNSPRLGTIFLLCLVQKRGLKGFVFMRHLTYISVTSHLGADFLVLKVHILSYRCIIWNTPIYVDIGNPCFWRKACIIKKCGSCWVGDAGNRIIRSYNIDLDLLEYPLQYANSDKVLQLLEPCIFYCR